MAELTPLYMDISNVYSGDELGLPYRDIMSEGVVGAGDLAVTQHAGGANLSVDVAAGAAWILGDTDTNAQPCYRVRNDAVVNKGITPDPSNPRIVLIVGQITDQTFAGTSRQWAITAIHGTPAPSPVAPALPASALLLATVTVPAAATSIVTANIADNRVRASVGGGQAVPASTAGLVKLWDSVEAGVSLPAASISTPTLPQTYKHLVIEMIGRDTGVANLVRESVRLNNDAGATQYNWMGVENNGGSLVAQSGVGVSSFGPVAFVGASGGGQVVGGGTIRIRDYARTNWLKLLEAVGGGMYVGGSANAGIIGTYTGIWNAVGPVTSIQFISGSASFAAGSRFTVYGEA